MIFGNAFVNLLFSKDFVPIITLFSLWFIFDLLRLASWPIGLVLIVKDRMKLAASLELGLSIILLSTSYLVIGRYSLVGVMFSYVFSYAIFLVINYLVMNRNYAIKINARTISIFCISFILIFFSGKPGKALLDYIVIFLLVCVFSVIIFKKHERLLMQDVLKKAIAWNS